MTLGEGTRAPARRPSVLRLLGAQVGYQLRVLVRSPIGSFATLVIPLMVLLAVNLLYRGTHLASRGGIAYAQFFTPAMVAFAVVNACYMSVISSTTLARDEGILKRIRGTPLPPWVYMAGRLGAAALVALTSAVVVVAVGALVYDFEIVWSAIPAVLLILALAMFCFCALGLAVTVLVPAADSALPVAWGTILPLCFISDVFMPIDSAPHWLRAIASFFPLRAFADDLEAAFNPVTGSSALQLHSVEVLAAWGVAATVFALLTFRWEPAVSGRHRRPEASAAFAVDRVRALFEQIGARPAQAQPRERRSAGRQRAPHTKVDCGTVEPTVTEVIEGPAPDEDSNVPADPAKTQSSPAWPEPLTLLHSLHIQELGREQAAAAFEAAPTRGWQLLGSGTDVSVSEREREYLQQTNGKRPQAIAIYDEAAGRWAEFVGGHLKFLTNNNGERCCAACEKGSPGTYWVTEKTRVFIKP
jgi:ABC-type multidrug transport system permease subunit